MARSPSALTTFVRSLPHDMPVSEVVEKAKAEGMEATVEKVSRVRQMDAAKPRRRVASKPSAPSKSDFIRQHPDLSTADLIAAGKAEGLNFTSSLVYVVRDKMAGKGAPAAKKPAARRKAPSPSKPVPQMSKSDFIRQQPVTMPVAEVIAAGAKAGLAVGANLVYLVRGRMGGKATPRKAASRLPRPSRSKTPASAPVVTRAAIPTTASEPEVTTTTAPTPVVSSASSLEGLLKAIAAELGLGRAVDVLEGERARVRAVIGEG
jgi:hypothetical protein